MDRALGIDVNHFRPVHDWSAVLGAGVSFVGMKATQGETNVDPMLRAHRIGFRSQPFVLGIYYHFASPGDPVKQARHHLDVVGELLPRERLALDVEERTLPDGTVVPPPSVDWVRAYLAELPTDRRHLVYSSRRVWPAGDFDGSLYDLWAPRYQSGDQEPELPAPWSSWTFWQFSESYQCPGLAQACDANWFRGSVEEMGDYARLPVPALPPSPFA